MGPRRAHAAPGVRRGRQRRGEPHGPVRAAAGRPRRPRGPQGATGPGLPGVPGGPGHRAADRARGGRPGPRPHGHGGRPGRRRAARRPWHARCAPDRAWCVRGGGTVGAPCRPAAGRAGRRDVQGREQQDLQPQGGRRTGPATAGRLGVRPRGRPGRGVRRCGAAAAGRTPRRREGGVRGFRQGHRRAGQRAPRGPAAPHDRAEGRRRPDRVHRRGLGHQARRPELPVHGRPGRLRAVRLRQGGHHRQRCPQGTPHAAEPDTRAGRPPAATVPRCWASSWPPTGTSGWSAWTRSSSPTVACSR